MMVCHAIVATAQTEKGQWSLVPMAGTNVIISKPLDALWGVTAGVAVDWQASNRIALSSGVSYSYQRYGFQDVGMAYVPLNISPLNNSAYNQVLGQNRLYNPPIRDGRLVVPLMVSVYVWKGLALKAGIQANFRLHSGKADYHEEIAGYHEGDATYGLPSELDISGTAYAMHDFFFSLPVGISYEYRKFVLDVRYIFGLQNLSSTWDVTSKSNYNMEIRYTGGTQYDSQKVNQLQLTLGYRIGL